VTRKTIIALHPYFQSSGLSRGKIFQMMVVKGQGAFLGVLLSLAVQLKRNDYLSLRKRGWLALRIDLSL